MSKGGHTRGTWESGSTWASGPTQTIRVPIALAAQIMEYARAIDSGVDVSHVNTTAEIILKAIDSYSEFRQQHHQPNQHSQKPKISSRTWDELRRFRHLVQDNPQVLGLPGAD